MTKIKNLINKGVKIHLHFLWLISFFLPICLVKYYSAFKTHFQVSCII